jgi:hypothetical protein
MKTTLKEIRVLSIPKLIIGLKASSFLKRRNANKKNDPAKMENCEIGFESLNLFVKRAVRQPSAIESMQDK